jgi:hypothetical protein
MTFLYGGEIGGIVFLFFWSMICTIVIRLRINVLYKVLFFMFFVVEYFTGGSLLTTVERFYEALIAIVLCCSILAFGRFMRYLAFGPSPRRSLAEVS